MFEKWDLVKVVDADNEYKGFIGQEGVVIEVEKEYEYPYLVVFFNKEYQRVSINNGELLWKENDLEGI